MDATHALETFGDVLKMLNKRVSNLQTELDEVYEQWNGLKNVGGARDDHAAEFLKRFRSHMAGFATFAGHIDGQLEKVITNPFDRKG